MAACLYHQPEDESIYAKLIPNQKYALIETFTLESGVELQSIPIAYSTWGTLNEDCNNALIVCHALSGSSYLKDWWGPLLGPGKAFDQLRFFIICFNVLGSPYGSASPATLNPRTGRLYGPDFPSTTVRDDVRAQKLVLDAIGVKQVAAVVGGSLGGMTTLEWPLCTPTGYIRNVVPIATSASHNAWGIAWGEAQRQCIFADERFNEGHYEMTSGQPMKGLSCARKVGMLTYRSSMSFGSRFGRSAGRPSPKRLSLPLESGMPSSNSSSKAVGDGCDKEPVENVSTDANDRFTAQDYLDYQGEKFVRRFDANCYVHLSLKMDQHDITRGRNTSNGIHREGFEAVRAVLARAPPHALVVGVTTDILFCPEEQALLAKALPDATFSMVESSDGHDGFLLAFDQLNALISQKLQEQCPELYEGSRTLESAEYIDAPQATDSVFGEMESGWK